MKFGKVIDLKGIDFSLPPVLPADIDVLPGNNSTPKVFIGATGWTMPEWKGTTYPSKIRTKDYLFHYARQFNSIELNTVHYRLPTLSTIEKWMADVPSDFKFCPKVWKNISHRKSLGIEDGSITRFCEVISHFGEHLGPCFLQLPPYFSYDQSEILWRCLQMFPSDMELAIEVRHASFFTSRNFKLFAERLTRLGITLTITDVAGRRDIIHSRLTNHNAFIRWVGNGLHETDYERLQDWKERIMLWQQKGIQSIYFFPHQPDNVLTPEISSYFYDELAKNICLVGRAPNADAHQDPQLKIF